MLILSQLHIYLASSSSVKLDSNVFCIKTHASLGLFSPSHGLQSRDHVDIFYYKFNWDININMSVATRSLKTYYLRATANKYSSQSKLACPKVTLFVPNHMPNMIFY